MEPQRIGLMGGSFNPIHQMHVEMARLAMREAALDKVLFLSSGNPPHKRENLAPARQRYQMVCLALAQEKALLPSDIELNRSGTIYTVDTLALLQNSMPQAEFFYIIGEDTLYELPKWREPDRVFRMCRFLVLKRPGLWTEADAAQWREALRRQGARFTFLSGRPRDVSSTAIREQLHKGEEPAGLPPAVMEYIRVMGLYGINPSPPGFAGHMDRLMGAMSTSRMTHTLCVAYAARRLAMLHGVAPERAALAGLLHDCAKGMALAEMQAYARAHQVSVEPSLLSSGALLHAAVGAHMARAVYGVEDEGVLSAIASHTLGCVPMAPLEMIVYLADKVEPGRENYPGLEEIRRLAETDLKGAVLLSMERTESYVKERGKALHPATERTIKWLRETLKKQRNDTKEENA